ncbi:MAG: AAA family ATPase [Clostridia bacterium]|nr:AAA family ATPase [Clostridia bacterium]
MIYVNGISVEHYKGLRNISLANFSPITIITGPNGCGKTSLTEAIEIILNPLNFNHYIAVTQTKNQGFWNSFDKQQARLYTRIDGEILKQSYFTEIVSYQPIFQEPFLGFHHFGYPKNGRDIIESKEIDYSVSKNQSQSFSDPIVRYRKLTPQNQNLSFQTIREDQLLCEKALSYLSLFDSDYAGFQTENFKDTVLYHKKYNRVSEDFFSDGIRYVLKIMEQLSGFSNGVVIIDPAEHQIAPNTFPFMVELLYHVASKRQLQLFLTTQSMEFVDEWLDLLHFYRQLSEITLVKLRSKPDGCSAKQYSGELMYQLRMEHQTDFRCSDFN